MNATAQIDINSSSIENGSDFANIRRDTLVVSMLPFMMNVYLLFVTAAYEVQTRRSNYNSEAGKTLKADERMRMVILGAAFMTFVRQVFRTLEVSEGFTNDSVCLIVRKVTDALFVLVISLIYFTLWLRQRVFYTSLLTSSLNSNFTKILGWCVIVLVVVGGAVGISLYLGTLTYKSSELGCIINETFVAAEVPPAYYISTVVLFQFILLYLFVYPLVKHNRYMNTTQLNTFPKATYKLLKRVAIVTAIDVSLDVIMISLAQILRFYFSLTYLIFLFDVVLTKSCVCVICSFKDWKYRLCPFNCCARTNDLKGIQISSVQMPKHSP